MNNRTTHPAIDTTLKVGDRVTFRYARGRGRILKLLKLRRVLVRDDEGATHNCGLESVSYEPDDAELSQRARSIRDYNEEQMLDSVRMSEFCTTRRYEPSIREYEATYFDS
jgi:hypothetical protein